MPDVLEHTSVPRLRGRDGRRLRVGHLTTIDMSLALLLQTELQVDVDSGLETFGLSAEGPYVDRVSQLGVEHVPIASLTRAWDLGGDLAAARELLTVVRRLGLDVLHTHNPKTGVLGRLVGRLARVPVVVNTCHGLWAQQEDTVLRRITVYGLESAAARLSDAELYQNGADRQTLQRWVRQSKTRVVGNGTDLVRFHPDPSLAEPLRVELGVGPSELLVGGVGRLVAEKGIHEFVHAARALEGKARFVWFGPPDPAKSDSFSPGGSNVLFAGERSDMPAVYNAMDVFVLPSHREGFSRSAMEAAACGTPMVLSDIRGCREIGSHGKELLLVPPRDPVALAEQVEVLLLDPALRNRLALAAQERATAAFDQRRVAVTSLETYAEIAARKGLGWTVEGGAR